MDPVNKVDALVFAKCCDAVDNTGTKHYDDAVRLLAPSDREIYDGDRDYIIREQQEIIRLLREQNEALQREVVGLRARLSAVELEKFETMEKARVDLATCGYDFTVSQLVYALKHADGFVEGLKSIQWLQERDSILR
jgi:hypothetical protein